MRRGHDQLMRQDEMMRELEAKWETIRLNNQVAREKMLQAWNWVIEALGWQAANAWIDTLPDNISHADLEAACNARYEKYITDTRAETAYRKCLQEEDMQRAYEEGNDWSRDAMGPMVAGAQL